MVKAVFIGMGLVALATVIGSFGALLLKIASAKVTRNPLSFLKIGKIYGGIFLYGISALIFIYALRFGELSVLYPLAGLSYIWTSLLSIKFLNEEINLYKWLGIFLIILGVIFIGLGA
ncbi:MAG: EamA family transporter [Nanoarchaeota archaeon]